MVNRTQSAVAATSLYSSNVGKGRKSPPRFSDDSTVDELVQIAHENLDVMTPVATAALWTKISRQLSRRDGRNNDNYNARMDEGGQNARKIDDIFQHTIDRLGAFSAWELTQTILSLSKITVALQKHRSRRGEANHKRVPRERLLNRNMTPKEDVFRLFAVKVIDKLDTFDARSLSNLAYAYALVGYVPDFDDGSDLFDHIATEAVDMKGDFNAQDISNLVWAFATVNKPHAVLFEMMGDQVVAFKRLEEFIPQHFSNTVWAYATAGITHPELFETVANHIVKSDVLHRFDPQALSNTVWAYATEGINRPKLFETVANHIVESDNLNRFKPQALSNIMWAVATAGINHPRLFEKMAKHIVDSNSLHRFNPQNLANTVWAFATVSINYPKLLEKVAKYIAKSDILDRFSPQNLSNTVWAYATASINHPRLFEKVASHIVVSDSLDQFKPQALSNTVWAYATAQVSHPKLYQKIANAALQRKTEFDSQGVANLLWAYATMGIIDKQLFSSFAQTATKLVDSYNNQDLGNIAWAYAVANIEAPTLFNDTFIEECAEKKGVFEIEALSQLYQWHLWQTKEKCNPGLSEGLLDKCHEAFISQDPTISKLQEDVVAQLSSIGLEPKEEVLVDSGYRIDAIVEVNGKTIGVEVDGPWHFIGMSTLPLGRTILKRRQVPSIDGIELVSVSCWQWNKLGKDQTQQQEYLRKLLGLAAAEERSWQGTDKQAGVSA